MKKSASQLAGERAWLWCSLGKDGNKICGDEEPAIEEVLPMAGGMKDPLFPLSQTHECMSMNIEHGS